jgi:branched-chain amino acid transport system permease protein
MLFALHIFTVICMTLPTVIAYHLVFGKGKILHFGQIAFSIVGGYTLWILVIQFHFSILAAFCIALLAVAIVALLFAFLSLRLEADGFGVMSIAVHLMMLVIVLNWQSVTRGALGVPGIPRPGFASDNLSFAIFAAVITCVWLLLIWWIDRGRIGRALSALSEHPWYARSLGIDQSIIHLIVFLIAGIGALLVNFLFHSYLYLLSPTDFGFPAMIFYVMIIVAGGSGSLKGAVIATITLNILKEALRFVPLSAGILGPVRLILFGLILFAAVWWRRDSLFPKQRTI